MKYYQIMLDDESISDECITCYSEDNFQEKYNIEKYGVFEGKKIENWDNNFTFFYDEKEGHICTDYLVNNLGWFIVSRKYRLILEKLNVTQVQYLPVSIKEKSSGKELNEYCIVNITTLVDALDLNNSEYKEFTTKEKKILSIKKYALREEDLNGLHLVRLKESRFATFVSQAIKEEVQKNNLTACGFLEVKVT